MVTTFVSGRVSAGHEGEDWGSEGRQTDGENTPALWRSGARHACTRFASAAHARTLFVKVAAHDVHARREAAEIVECVLRGQVPGAQDVLHLVGRLHAEWGADHMRRS